jgi:hypothetical protein
VHANSWREVRTEAPALDARARALGPSLNILAPGVPAGPSYEGFRPAQFLRPFDLAPRHGQVQGEAA